jgi:hypothetical protein
MSEIAEINLNEGVVKPPESTLKQGARENMDSYWIDTRVVTVEKVTDDLIEDVIVNPAAKDFLSTNLHYLASEKFIQDAAGIATPRIKEAVGDQILTPAIFGRAVATRVGKIPYANLIGGCVIYKGTGLSGFMYPTEQYPRGFFGGAWADSENPAGLLFKSDNDVDTEVSNVLLAEGARVSLNLGYLVLNESNFKDFLKKKWETYDPKIAGTMIKMIDDYKTVYPEDKLVIAAKIGGTPQRLELLLHIKELSEQQDLTNYQKSLVKGNFAHGARIMLEESKTYSEKFTKYLNGSSLLRAQETLGRLSQYKPLSEKDIKVMEEVLSGMAVIDAKIISKLGADDPNYKSLFFHSFSLKDTDFSLIRYDFDVVGNSVTSPNFKEITDPNNYKKDSSYLSGEYLSLAEILMNGKDLWNSKELFEKRKIEMGKNISSRWMRG